MSDSGGVAPAKGRDSKSHSKGGKHSEHVSARKATALGGPKKGGAGGKGTWGKLEDDIAPVELARDDPAYGSDVRLGRGAGACPLTLRARSGPISASGGPQGGRPETCSAHL